MPWDKPAFNRSINCGRCTRAAGTIGWWSFVGINGIESITYWLFSGLLLGFLLLVAYIFVIRFHLAIVPLVIAVYGITEGLKEGLYYAYPDALGAAVFGTVLIGTLSFYWFKKLSITTGT